MDRTGRCTAPGAGAAVRGRAVMSSTVTAGMQESSGSATGYTGVAPDSVTDRAQRYTSRPARLRPAHMLSLPSRADVWSLGPTLRDRGGVPSPYASQGARPRRSVCARHRALVSLLQGRSRLEADLDPRSTLPGCCLLRRAHLPRAAAHRGGC